jgi:uncharacterized membrane protein YdjX (TVP38/TMEM64 family)
MGGGRIVFYIHGGQHYAIQRRRAIVKSNSGRLKLALLVCGVAVCVAAAMLLPVKDALVATLEWVPELGFWGPVALAVLYVFACVFLVPGMVLTLGAGFLFGVVQGTIAVSLGSTAGACAAFLVGRTVARSWIEGKMAENPKFAAVSQAVARRGFLIVVLIRLSPAFPFNVLNYAFALTKISFWRYAIGSWIGMLPGTILYVYLGSGARSLADAAAGNLETGVAHRLFFWFGLIVTGIVTVVITAIARRALYRLAQEETYADRTASENPAL